MLTANGVMLDAFTVAYIEAALWSTNDESTPQGGEPLDRNYGIDDIAPEALAAIVADCAKFQAEHGATIDRAETTPYSSEPYRKRAHAGHDFWLTRNGHGCGFWDGAWHGDSGKALTNASRAYGEVNPYVGDDGKIYGFGE